MALVILALGNMTLGIMSGQPFLGIFIISKTLLHSGCGIFSKRGSAKILSEYRRKYN